MAIVLNNLYIFVWIQGFSGPPLTLNMTLWAVSADNVLVIFFLFSKKIGSDTSCKVSLIQCQDLFSLTSKNI